MLARIALSWALWAIGHFFAHKVLLRWHLPFAYPIYNWLMLRSSDLQADDPRGPWQPPALADRLNLRETHYLDTPALRRAIADADAGKFVE
jgi:hypothetical protein